MTGLINHRNFSLENTPPLTDKVAILTGGNDGIGREIAAQLLKHDIAKIYILARSFEKFDETKRVWSERHGLKEGDIKKAEFLPCDLSDVTVVKKVADSLVRKLDRLDILLLNAGLPTQKEYTLSPQGIENSFATNVLGHFVLTQILLETIEDSAEKYGDARIVTTSSSFYTGCQELDFNLLKSPTPIKSPEVLDSCWRYARSKLGTILFTRKLAHRLNNHGAMNVYANTFFPGNIPTDAVDAWKELIGTIPGVSLTGMFDSEGQSLEDGASTAIYLAASKDVKEKGLKGKYFVPIGEQSETTELAKDRDLARNLWYWCDAQVTQVLGKNWQEVSNGE